MEAADLIELLWQIILGLPGGILGLTDVTQINDIVCRDAAGNRGTCDGDTTLNERGLTAQGDAPRPRP